MFPTPSRAPTDIHCLPPELLCLIFTFAANGPCGIDKDISAPSPIVFTLTRICGRWRGITRGVPDLWTNIRLSRFLPSHSEMLDECLCRSKDLPLDITLAIIDEVPPSNFLGIVAKIWSVAHRWRTFSFSTTDSNFGAMRILGCTSAPLLETLKVSAIGSPTGPDVAFPPLWSLPALKCLIACRIHLQVSDADRLEILDLSYTYAGGEELPKKLARQFASGSRDNPATPYLRHFTLRAPHLTLRAPSTATFGAYIAALTTLRLGNLCVSDLQQLVPLLPRLLEELTLCDMFPRVLASFAATVRNRFIVFPALQALTLGTAHNVVVLGILARASPALRRLSLRPADTGGFVAMLAPLADTDADIAPAPQLWPQLRALKISGPDIDLLQLRTLVEARLAHGCPLAPLEIDTPVVLHVESLLWLETHVERFKRNAPA
ncbi:hypothetical protein GGX14DRAFT_660390 [Mycena pura]|uniref:F-box domain-containing protein n=1 Tax=Mycena pura TaxID=153505 RepID=A0AAD6Y984_9AGAR|nr:hypothetical protein GGX14DRAFT_660390 [Mycena pura]